MSPQQTVTVPLSAHVVQDPPRSPEDRRRHWRESFDQPRRGTMGTIDSWHRDGIDPSCAFCRRQARYVWEEPDEGRHPGFWRPAQGGEECPDRATPDVEEWPEHVAFRPLNPVTPLHTLVVPKAHVPNHTHGVALAETMMRAAELARGFEYSGWDTNIISSAGKSATQSVRHLHVHVIPRASDDGLMLPWGTLSSEDPTAPHRCRRMAGLEAEIVRLGGDPAVVK